MTKLCDFPRVRSAKGIGIAGRTPLGEFVIVCPDKETALRYWAKLMPGEPLNEDEVDTVFMVRDKEPQP